MLMQKGDLGIKIRDAAKENFESISVSQFIRKAGFGNATFEVLDFLVDSVRKQAI